MRAQHVIRDQAQIFSSVYFRLLFGCITIHLSVVCQMYKIVQKNKFILEDRRPKEKCIQKLSMYLISIHVLLTLRLFRPRAYIQIYSNTRKEEEHFDLQKFQIENKVSF